MVSKTHSAAVPQLVVYTPLEPNSTPENITLQAQGEPVEISETPALHIIMKAFDIVHRISPEAILRLKTGERVLLFDHQNISVLRDENIMTEFGKVQEHRLETDKTNFLREHVIDLDSVWNDIKSANFFSSIGNALEKIQKEIRPSMVTTLIGSKAPALLFLFVQHKLYGKTGEIWYQENASVRPIIIIRHL